MPDTKTFMRDVRKKLARLVKMETNHCGHADGVRKAEEAKQELIRVIEDEHRRLTDGGMG